MVRERHTEWPHLEHYSNVPLFNTKAVVQQTGITAPTLRAWERRYMILSPERAQNDYRLYSERDIAIIRWLKERVDAGMAISQAIALFRHLEQEHHQLHRKDAPPGSTSPSQMMLPTTSGVEHEPIEGDEQVKNGAPQPALPNVQKFDAEVFVNGSQTSYNLRFIQKRLLEAFNILDEATASQLMASILAIYSITSRSEYIPKTYRRESHREEGTFFMSKKRKSSPQPRTRKTTYLKYVGHGGDQERATLLERILDAFVSVDSQWCFTYVNHHAEALLGKKREELLGRKVWELFPIPADSALYQNAHEALEKQTSLIFQEFHPLLNKWFEVRLYPFQDGLY